MNCNTEHGKVLIFNIGNFQMRLCLACGLQLKKELNRK